MYGYFHIRQSYKVAKEGSRQYGLTKFVLFIISASVKPFTEGVSFNGMNSDSPYSWFSRDLDMKQNNAQMNYFPEISATIYL